MLEIRNLHVEVGGTSILKGINLTIYPGEVHAIMGPNGSGKSTLLNILGTLEPPDAGTVTVAGEDPFQLSAEALARFHNRRVGFIFQEHHLLPKCTVVENVLVPTLVPSRDKASEDGLTRANDLLERMGLSDRLDHRPAELSGGERQRISIARAVLHNPRILILDEATSSVDTETEKKIQEALARLVKGRTTFAIAHRLSTLRNANRLMVLESGKCVE